MVIYGIYPKGGPFSDTSFCSQASNCTCTSVYLLVNPLTPSEGICVSTNIHMATSTLKYLPPQDQHSMEVMDLRLIKPCFLMHVAIRARKLVFGVLLREMSWYVT